MPVQIAYCQHVGLHKATQQDAMLVAGQVIQAKRVHGELLLAESDSALLGVADGVSGSPASGAASSFVMTTLSRSSATSLNAGVVRELQRHLTNQAGRGLARGAATTIAAVGLMQQRCFVVNLGDSRVFRLGVDGSWEKVSRDHSYIQELIDSGAIDGKDREIGLYDQATEYLIAEDLDEASLPIFSQIVALHPGERVLLCTDGVFDALGVDELQAATKATYTLSEQVAEWSALVLAAGATDNYSMILVSVVAEAEQV